MTFLGFYGISPNVDIRIKDAALPVDRLSFVFIGGEGEGEFEMGLALRDPQGNEVGKFPLQKVVLKKGKAQSNIVVTLGRMVFKSFGEYEIVLRASGKERFSAKFKVSEGNESDFV